jgi:predicted nucleic acid-binding Zn ribbon protein
MERKKKSLVPLKDVLSSLFSDSKLPFNPDDAHIWKVWDEIVGKPISEHAQPLWIKDGKLRVKVSDPIWLQELGFVEENIKEKLNSKLGRRAVEKIEFRLATSRLHKRRS